MHACSACGYENQPGARFCGGCGTPLQDRVTRERRQLTVMFCDLVGLTALAERLDPEELADLVLAYQQAAGSAIQAFDGHVAQHLGDGLLVYFGYPLAHEDDARRAVHASLGVIDALGTVNARLGPERKLSVRIGIHTGPVVTGELGSGTTQERLALGSTPNIAAKLQNLAMPDTVVVSGQTRALLRDAFVCEPLGPAALGGLSQPVDVFRVVARVDTSALGAASDMVGRREELARAWRAYEEVSAGGCGMVMVTGEAGVGKSHLVQMLRTRVVAEGGECWVAQCSPYEQTSALRPVAALVRRIADLPGGQDADAEWASLVSALGGLGFPLAETVPLIAGLLSVPLQAPYEAPDVTPHRRKELTLQAVADVLIRRAGQRPVVWLLEDLHWADPSTIDFIGLLLSRASSARLLLLLTSRPGFAAPWIDRAVRVELTPMDPADVRAIIARVTGGRPLPGRLVEHIVEKTDGIPLFAEELTKAILESGDLTETAEGYSVRDPAAMAVPVSLQASLIARLDRLGPAKEVGQLGSVIGRDFGFDLCQAVAPWSEEVLLRGLARLTHADLVHQRGTPPAAIYSFKHALIRDAAYEMLLKSARRDYHRRIGEALVARFPAVVEARPELVAHHFTEAGAAEVAVQYWLKAGQKAAGESANAEAITHLHRALALIETLPASPQRDAMELGALLTIGPPLTLAKGYVAEEVERTYLRAQELNERGGDPTQRFWIGIGISQFRVIRGEVAEGLRILLRLLALAESLGEPRFVTRVQCILGVTATYAGDFAAAASWQERALAGMDGEDLEFLTYTGMSLPGLTHVYAAYASWHLGSPERARAHIDAALAAAAATGRIHALGQVVVYGAMHVHCFLEDTAAVRRFAAQATALSASHGFLTWDILAGICLAWADVRSADEPLRDRADATLAMVRAFQGMGARLTQRLLLALTAEIYWKSGAPDVAEALVDEALALDPQFHDPMWDAELHRLKGELMLARAGSQDVPEAAAHLTQALQIAQRQGSRALEQRALSSLSRVAQR